MHNKLQFLFLLLFQPLKAGIKQSYQWAVPKQEAGEFGSQVTFMDPCPVKLGEKCGLSNAVHFLLENWSNLTDIFYV